MYQAFLTTAWASPHFRRKPALRAFLQLGLGSSNSFLQAEEPSGAPAGGATPPACEHFAPRASAPPLDDDRPRPCRFFGTPGGCRYGPRCRYSHERAGGRAGGADARVELGLGRIVALYHRSSTSHQIF
jgi:hypothetical protein